MAPITVAVESPTTPAAAMALLHCAIPRARQGMITRMPRWSYGDCQVVEGLP